MMLKLSSISRFSFLRSHTLPLLRTAGLFALFASSSFASDVRVFHVSATRFEFRPARLEVRQGDVVRITLQSDDVAHGFQVEGYGLNVEIPPPSETATVEFIADRPGTFAFACSEYCGLGHANMLGELVVVPTGESVASSPSTSAVEQSSAHADVSVVNLPTAYRVPKGKFAFRVTHRFGRPLGRGSFGNLVEDLFGLDGGAQIGLGLQYGLAPGVRAAFYRVSDRTIQLSGNVSVLRQERLPFGLNVVASIEGRNNFREEYSPAVTAIFSRAFADRAVIYAEPSWVGNTNLAEGTEDEDSSLLLGLGGRLRLSDSVYFVGEVSPRLAGFKGRTSGRSSDALASFGVEMQYGGHVFQINVSNDLGTTPAQIARGRQGPDDWFLGFNISRKFF